VARLFPEPAHLSTSFQESEHRPRQISPTLPHNYAFTTRDNGVHTFTNLILRTKGLQTITVTDTVNSTITVSLVINVT
jgi:hypothetical protein